MNLFPVSDSNESELTFVVSRASANADDKVHAVAARIVREMETSLPEFRLESTEMTMIDGFISIWKTIRRCFSARR